MLTRLLIFAVMVLGLAAPSLGQERGALRDGFSAAAFAGQKVVLLRPTVWVGSQSTGGMGEPNAEWTSTARTLMNTELLRQQGQLGLDLIPEPDLVGADAKLVSEHKALFNAVAKSVMIYQFFPGNRLPTRKNKPFDWTLGEGTRRISEITGARFGLFVTTRDEYGSFGRKMFQLFAAGLVGVGVNSGVHYGYAGLVDLETGQLLWLNADGQMGGDVRNPDGMARRISQLLEDFPGSKRSAAK